MVRPDWTEETAVILYTEETIPYTARIRPYLFLSPSIVSSSRPQRSTISQQNLNLKQLSRNSLLGNSYSPLGNLESITTSNEPEFRDDDEMEDATLSC